MVLCKPKKAVSVPAFLTPVIQKITQAKTCTELASVLDRFDAPFHFERPTERNLFNWAAVLNKFDDVLETYIRQHSILSLVPELSSSSHSCLGNDILSGPSNRPSGTHLAPPSGVPPRVTYPASPSRRQGQRIPQQPEPQGKKPSSAGESGSASTSGATTGGLVSSNVVPGPIPASLVVLILRATSRLIRNASYDTKGAYCSGERLGTLLADSNINVVVNALEALYALLQRSSKHRQPRAPVNPDLVERLYELSLGWGGREKGLGLVDCCSELNNTLPVEGHFFSLEYSKSKPDLQKASASGDAATSAPVSRTVSERRSSSTPSFDQDSGGGSSGSACVLLQDVRELQQSPEIEKWLISEFATAKEIPRSKIFALLAAFRRAKAFGQGLEVRREMTWLQLLAITTLAQSHPIARRLSELFQKEPELISDIIAIARADPADGLQGVPKNMRINAVRCLTAMSSERSRLSQITSAAGVGSHHGVFSSLLRSTMSTLLGSPSERDCSGEVDHSVPLEGQANQDSANDTREQMETDSRTDEMKPLKGTPESQLSDANVSAGHYPDVYMAEAVLNLIHGIATTGGSAGASALIRSGTLGIIVPLIRDRNPRHTRAVAQGIRAMQSIIEATHASSGSQAFRDHDGLTVVAERITVETLGAVNLSEEPSEEVLSAEDERLEQFALQARGESRALYDDLLKKPMTVARALANQAPSSSAASRGSLSHSKWTLLRSLHQLFLLALGSGGNQVRDLVANTGLPRALRQILARPFHYGGGLFASAAMVATAIAHAEPTATAELVRAGIASAVLRTIALGLPPYGEAIRCIPNALAAICLAPHARDDIVAASPLRPYILRLATPFYSRALTAEVPAHIGGALDELMRHVEALRPDGNNAIFEFLQRAADFVQLDTSSLSDTVAVAGKADPRETEISSSRHDSGRRGDMSTSGGKETHNSQSETDSSPPDAVIMERMKLSVANNAARLAGFAQGSAEHQTAIVQKGGLEQMLKLRLAPAMAATPTKPPVRDGHAPTRSSPSPGNAIVSLSSSLRSFSSRHDTTVLCALFGVIKEDAAHVLKIASKLGSNWLPEEESEAENTSDSQYQDISKNGDCVTLPSESKVSIEIDKEMSTEDPENIRDASSIRDELRNALCVLRVDVVLLGSLSRSGPGSPAGAWHAAGGPTVTALIASVERAARWHLASVYTGLSLTTAGGESDLCTAKVTAAGNPCLQPMDLDDSAELVQQASAKFGVNSADSVELIEVCKSLKVPPEKDDTQRVELKGLAWALETFVVAAQRLYAALARGITFSSRRLTRDPMRYANSARSLASTIGRLFVLHLKAADSLWSRKVITMGDGEVSAAWDYVRRVLSEIANAIFCDSHRSTQALILKSFLCAGGAKALQRACRPSALLAGTKRVISSDSRINGEAFYENQKRFEKFMKSNHLTVAYFVLALGRYRIERERREETSREVVARTESRSVDADAVMSVGSPSASAQKSGEAKSKERSPDAKRPSSLSESRNKKPRTADSCGKLVNMVGNAESSIGTFALSNNQLEELEHQVNTIAAAVLHSRKQTAVTKIAADAWGQLLVLVNLLTTCPSLLTSPPVSLPVDPSSKQSEWEPRDVQRTAQTVAMNLMAEVLAEPKELLSASRPGGNLISDIVSVVHSISQTSEELSRSQDQDSNDNPHESGDNDRGHRVARDLRSRTPDPEMVRTLVDMGFPEARATEALRRTAPPVSIEYATEWLLNHRENADGGVESDESSDDEQQGSGSDGGAENGEDPVADTSAENANPDTEMNPADGQEGSPSENGVAENAVSGPEDGQDSVAPSLMGDGNTVGAVGLPSPAQCSNQSSSADVDNAMVKDSSEGSRGMRGKKKTISEETTTYTFDVDTESEQLLLRSVQVEMDTLAAATSSSKDLSKKDRDRINETVGSLVREKPHELDNGKTGSQATKSKDINCKAVSIESYKDLRKSLFESLIPVANAAIRRKMDQTSLAHFSFVAVEILSVLQKDKCLSDEVRGQFAKTIASELESYLHSSSEPGQGLHSVVGIRMACVWSHYGGHRARASLQSCGVGNLAFHSLVNLKKAWESVSTKPVVDEDATRPIRHLSINEDRESRHPTASGADSVMEVTLSGKKQSSSPRALLVPRKEQMQYLHAMCTCFLIIDAFVRFRSMDDIAANAKAFVDRSKENSAMDVDDSDDEKYLMRSREIEEDGRAGESEEAGVSRSGRTEELDSEQNDSSTMEIEKPATENVDEYAFLKTRAEKKRKEAIESAAKRMASLTNLDDSSLGFEFTLPAVLEMCVYFLRAWQKYEVGDAMSALLQLVSSLTTDPSLAASFLDQGGVTLLLDLPHLESHRIRSSSPKIIRGLVRTILRHIVEDKETLTEAMEADIRGIIGTAQSRGRAISTVRSLLACTSGMMSRDMDCFTRAFGLAVRIRPGTLTLGESIQTTECENRTLEEWTNESKKRKNVLSVVEALSKLLIGRTDRGVRGDASFSDSGSLFVDSLRSGLTVFSLGLLSELCEFSPAVAAGFLQVQSPCSIVKGSALDFVVQQLLPFPDRDALTPKKPGSSTGPMQAIWNQKEEAATAARGLVVALFSKTAGAYKQSVDALAEAAMLESSKEEASGGMLRSLGSCITSNVKLRVLKAMLESGLANSLAKCLRKLNMSQERNWEVAGTVLKALSLIGQTSIHLLRSGGNAGEDERLITQSRELWASLRDREDGGYPSASYPHAGEFLVI